MLLSAGVLCALGALLVVALARHEAAPVSAAVPDAGPAKRVLRFGKTPTVSARKAYEVYSVFLSLVEENLPCCTFELVLAPDYGACVDMLARGEVDVAWLGTSTFVQSRDKVPMTPLVRPVWEGNTNYRGVIFTVEETGISRVEELRGKRLALVDRESASGAVYPALLLGEHGLSVPKDFATVDYLGSHDAVLVAVLLGEYDAGAVFERAFTAMADRGKRVRLRVLASTEPIPGEPIVASARLEPELAEAIKQAFLAVRQERVSHPMLSDFFAFEPANDEDYDAVRTSGAGAGKL